MSDTKQTRAQALAKLAELRAALEAERNEVRREHLRWMIAELEETIKELR